MSEGNHRQSEEGENGQGKRKDVLDRMAEEFGLFEDSTWEGEIADMENGEETEQESDQLTRLITDEYAQSAVLALGECVETSAKRDVANERTKGLFRSQG